MIRRVIGPNQDDKIGGIYINVFDRDGEDDDKVRYCESCKANGLLRILKSRLYLDDKGKAVEPEPDFDSWRQCWTCGDIVKVSETKIEGSLDDIVEVEEVKRTRSDTIFTNKRKGRLQKIRDSRNKINDPDVVKAIKQGKKVTNYEEYQLD